MAENEEFIENQGRRRGGISSQAGLSTFVGGRVKSLPTVDKGDRVRAGQMLKEPGGKPLPLSAAPGMIRGIPQAIINSGGGEPGQSVAGAAAQGFAGGMLAGAQLNLGERMATPGQGTGDSVGKSPVRNAEGQSLKDLSAPALDEDPLPGTSQPLLVDALDEAQGMSPRHAAKSASRAVTMHPDHVAALKSLEGRHEDGLESGGSHFGR